MHFPWLARLLLREQHTASKRHSADRPTTRVGMAKKTVVEIKKTPARASSTRGVQSVARDLSMHFFNNPEAGDTLEGIADWWVARQRRSNAIGVVRSALEHLVDEGKISVRNYGDRELYVAIQND